MNHQDRLRRARMSRRDFLRISGAGLAGAALLGTAGCGGDQEGATSGSLRIAVIGSRESAERRQSLVPPFTEQFPEATVEFIPVQATTWEEYFSKILSSIAAGEQIDLAYVATEGTHLFAEEGLAIPLDDYVREAQEDLQGYFSDVHPSLVESMMYEGSLFMLPIDFNAANMFYNTRVLEEAGFDRPADDWTLDDFAEIARGLTGEDRFGYGWINRLWGSWLPWIFVNESNLLTEERASGGDWVWDTFYADDPAAEGRGGGWLWTEPVANSEANLEALQFVVDMIEEDVTPVPELGGGTTLQGFFTSGRIGMSPAGGFWAGGLSGAGMAPDEFDVQFMPRWQSQRHQFGSTGYVVMDGSENQELAWEFVRYLTSEEAMQIGLEGNLATPARRSMMTPERFEETGPEHWEVFYETLDRFPDTAPIPAPPQQNELANIFTKHTQLAVTMEATPQQALDEMQRELEGVFG